MLTKILNYAFNRGIISLLALARLDLKRLALSAEIQTNWMSRTLGSMMLRPGLAYIDGIFGNLFAKHIPFIFSIPDTAIIELTNNVMRVRVNEQIITRGSVSTTITNPNFTSDLGGWTQNDDVGGLSQWASGSFMSLSGNGVAHGQRYQTVTVSGGNIGQEHALRIVVSKGYVELRVGTTNGDDSYITSTILLPGIHSLALTPSGNFVIQVQSATVYTTLIKSINIEAAGAMTITTPWPTAMLKYLRWDESADVIFVASDGTVPQQRIERRAKRSWSLVIYLADDGPFLNQNINQSILLTPGALVGDTTLSSNNPFFKPGHVGSLFRLFSQSGQEVTKSVSGTGQWSDPIEVTGITANGGRNLTINIAGTWVGKIVLQFSVGAPGAWVNSGQSWTTNQTNLVYNDGFDNQDIFYRIGFDTTYTSGTANVQLDFAVSGTTAGIIRIDSFSSNTQVVGHVLVPFTSVGATSQWAQGLWSSLRGYPTAIGFYEGRLWQMGQDYVAGSVSDAYASYDDTVTGNSGPIIRTLAQGPVSVINWMLGLNRLLVGCDGSEQSIRSDSLDTPLTPTNFNAKAPSTRGSAAVAALKIDTNGIFVQRGDPDSDNTSGSRLIQLSYQGTYAIIDYTTIDLSEFCPELVSVGITMLAVQRKIDTRIHCLLTDGTVAVCIYDPVENEKGFLLVKTAGVVEDIVIMPGGVEDKVYYAVNRTINGSTARYFERWSMESECTGLPVAKLSDSHIAYSGAPTTTITGLGTLEAQTVTVWGWNTSTPFTVTMPNGTTQIVGRDLGTHTVVSGQITGLSAAVTNAIVGIGYVAQFKSVKLTQTVHDGTTLGCAKKIDSLGVVLSNTHCQGLQYGPDFNTLDNLPMNEDGYNIDPNTIWAAYDNQAFSFDGDWNPDSRLCLQAASPRPCTVMAANIGVPASDH